MELDELNIALEELETRVERLRSLYEQYFMGIEKIPPHVPHKDVERRIYALRREQIRNTAKRFKLQTIIQRYNTFQQYWMRIMREIENGTYRRHVLRVEKSLSASVGQMAASVGRAGADSSSAAPAPGSRLDAQRRRQSQVVKTSEGEESGSGLGELARPTSFDVAEAIDDPLNASIPPPDPTRRRQGTDIHAPTHGPVPKGAAARPRVDVQRVAPPLKPKVPAPVPHGAVGSTPSPPVARPLPPRLADEAKRPFLPGPDAARNQTAVGPKKGDDSGGTAIPQPGSGPAAKAPKKPPPRRPDPMVRQLSGEDRSAERRAPAATASSSNRGTLSRQRVEQLATQLTDAKRRNNEAGSVSVDVLAKRLEATATQLRKKHVGRSVDFDVVIKGGRAILKPIVR